MLRSQSGRTWPHNQQQAAARCTHLAAFIEGSTALQKLKIPFTFTAITSTKQSQPPTCVMELLTRSKLSGSTSSVMVAVLPVTAQLILIVHIASAAEHCAGWMHSGSGQAHFLQPGQARRSGHGLPALTLRCSVLTISCIPCQ